MKTALVLGGGGSKGAYEIGVWKALDELGKKFDIVTGTSIGALIGVLYVQQDYQKAYDLFDTIQVEDVMVNGVNLDRDIELIMSQRGKYVDFLESYMHHKGADISPFIQLLDRMFDAEKFFHSPIDYGCMTVNFSKLTPQPMMKKDLTPDNTKDYMLASASCFPAFPMKTINHDHYIDGGYHDNVPVTLAKAMGAEEIIAVDLKSVGKNQVKAPQEHVTYIEPLVPLGSFLLFEHDRIHRNMQLGYQDAMKVFAHYVGTIYTFDVSANERMAEINDLLEAYFEDIDQVIHREKMNAIIKKIVNIKALSGMERYKEFAYPYFAMLEYTSFAFGIDDLGVKDIEVFLQDIVSVAKQEITLLDRDADAKIGFKDTIKDLKDLSEEEIICFIYHFLSNNDGSKVKEVETLSVMVSEAFIKAYALLALQHVLDTADVIVTQ